MFLDVSCPDCPDPSERVAWVREAVERYEPHLLAINGLGSEEEIDAALRNVGYYVPARETLVAPQVAQGIQGTKSAGVRFQQWGNLRGWEESELGCARYEGGERLPIFAGWARDRKRFRETQVTSARVPADVELRMLVGCADSMLPTVLAASFGSHADTPEYEAEIATRFQRAVDLAEQLDVLGVSVADTGTYVRELTDRVLLDHEGAWKVHRATVDASGYDGMRHPAIVVDLQEFHPDLRC